jgi:hypothetical protein
LLFKCTYDDNTETCSIDDWKPLQIWNYDGTSQICFVFNSGDPGSVRKSKKYGFSHGLHIYLFLQPNDFINYYIGDSEAVPVNGEIYRFLDGGLTSNLVMNKLVENKLGEPYNRCQIDLDEETDHESRLYKQIVRNNYTYRQANCYDLCYFKSLAAICNCSFTGQFWSFGR